MHAYTMTDTKQGSGIGRAIALAFAQAGAKRIVLVGRRAETLEETSVEIKKTSGDAQITIFPASVTDESAIQNIADEVKGWDVLISTLR